MRKYPAMTLPPIRPFPLIPSLHLRRVPRSPCKAPEGRAEVVAVQLQLLEARTPQGHEADAFHQRLEPNTRDGSQDVCLTGGGCRGGREGEGRVGHQVSIIRCEKE